MSLPARRRSDLIEYLSTRRGVRSPKSPTLAPPPTSHLQHAHPMWSCCSASYSSVCVCARVRVAQLLQLRRGDTVASGLSKVNPRSAVLGLCCLKKLPSCDTERKKITDNSATHRSHREPTVTLIRVQCAAVHGGTRPDRA